MQFAPLYQGDDLKVVKNHWIHHPWWCYSKSQKFTHFFNCYQPSLLKTKASLFPHDGAIQNQPRFLSSVLECGPIVGTSNSKIFLAIESTWELIQQAIANHEHCPFKFWNRGPYVVILLLKAPIYVGYGQIPKGLYVLCWDWTLCSKYRHHSRFNSKHNWGSLCDHWKSKRIFTLDSNNFYISKLNSQHNFPQEYYMTI